MSEVFSVPCFSCLLNKTVNPYYCKPENCDKLELWLLKVGSVKLEQENKEVVHKRWDSKEEDLLWKRMTEVKADSISQRVEQIAKELGRTEKAVYLRYCQLKEKRKSGDESVFEQPQQEIAEVETVERLMFVRGVGYCVKLSESICQKLNLKEKDFLIVQIDGNVLKLVPADITPRKTNKAKV